MKIKYFSIRAISVATYLGGPLAGGILISLNFNRFNQKDRAFWTLIISFLATVLLLWGLFLLPENVSNKLPKYLLPILYTPIIVFVVDEMQKQEIQNLENGEGEKEHWGKALALGLLGTALTLAISFQLASTEAPFQGDKFLYGKLQHEIYYQGESINDDLLYKVARDLESVGYFTDEFQQVAHMEEWKTRYVFSIYVDESFWENNEVLQQLGLLKNDLEKDLKKEITLKMLHPTALEIKERRID